MNTKNMTQEQISAFADGEIFGLADGEANSPEISLALDALRSDEGRKDWDTYHKIGDVLRSKDLAQDVSPDFMARFSARLEAEPTIIAPAALPAKARATPVRRFLVPGMAAAAAVAAVALVGPQQMMVARGPASASAELVRVVADGKEVLRDPAIDQYLMAHQRVSPAFYSTAQYARTAPVASDPVK